jgi:hypothetical protein
MDMDATSASAPAAFLDLAAGSARRFLDGEASAAAPRASERALGRATRSRSRSASCSRGAGVERRERVVARPRAVIERRRGRPRASAAVASFERLRFRARDGVVVSNVRLRARGAAPRGAIVARHRERRARVDVSIDRGSLVVPRRSRRARARVRGTRARARR